MVNARTVCDQDSVDTVIIVFFVGDEIDPVAAMIAATIATAVYLVVGWRPVRVSHLILQHRICLDFHNFQVLGQTHSTLE
jgi:hypothetical protein